jgi:predicted lipid-binding transport protein (Tim44 family)
MRAFVASIIGLLALSLAFDVEARRLGGGRNLGTQRQATPQQPAPKAPAQQQAGTQQTQPAQPAAAGNKWLGPLAGLALGAGLVALFLHNGTAGLLAGLLVIALMLAAAIYVARMMRARAAGATMLYAGAGAGDAAPRPPASAGAAPHAVAVTSRWPDGFDAAEFVRHAKRNFVRLQAAHDQSDITTVGDFLTPALAREIEADIAARAGAPQQTIVMTLNAEVLDVAIEGDHYVVSVRFSGLIRESADDEPVEFSETWHLEKPVRGHGGWLVAGIQQVQ